MECPDSSPGGVPPLRSQDQLNGLISRVGDAIVALSKMQSAWDSIKLDLDALRESMVELNWKPTPEDMKDSLDFILDDWQSLYDEGRPSGYIPAPHTLANVARSGYIHQERADDRGENHLCGRMDGRKH